MADYITTSVFYYVGDRASASDVLCAPRPSTNHVPGPSWQTAPLDPAVMWRLKTTAELTAEREAEAASRLDGDRLIRLLFEVNFDQENRLRAKESLPAVTKAQYRTALINIYKGLNGL